MQTRLKIVKRRKLSICFQRHDISDIRRLCHCNIRHVRLKCHFVSRRTSYNPEAVIIKIRCTLINGEFTRVCATDLSYHRLDITNEHKSTRKMIIAMITILEKSCEFFIALTYMRLFEV